MVAFVAVMHGDPGVARQVGHWTVDATISVGMEARLSPMLNRWRDQIDSGRERAQALSDDMIALAWGMVRIAAIAGLVVGSLIGGLLVWLIK
jgi:hypothetical protein